MSDYAARKLTPTASLNTRCRRPVWDRQSFKGVGEDRIAKPVRFDRADIAVREAVGVWTIHRPRETALVALQGRAILIPATVNRAPVDQWTGVGRHMRQHGRDDRAGACADRRPTVVGKNAEQRGAR